ncbi:hypothetical protein F2P56_029873 [Juglans regia]|uniref:DNA repair protein recA homolog 2, mitochondrial-like isoform X2 n=2 Tax=Juglans regia TaxID=51240 RepID=A0A2I4GII8_JUGRE|nr:DNA repair protein recA homolog 2, mitochondrial-like isoform X2 [Juglans regia]KAF5449428.1 hypothetical protein F2P56_029873 [Juglans regia]
MSRVNMVAALIPQCELDQTIGGTSKDEQSRIMTQALRKIHYSLSQSRTLIVFLNQIRLSPKSVQGFGRVDEVTCGGNALKFYASVRLKMIRKALLKTEDKWQWTKIGKKSGCNIAYSWLFYVAALRAVKSYELPVGLSLCFGSKLLCRKYSSWWLRGLC